MTHSTCCPRANRNSSTAPTRRLRIRGTFGDYRALSVDPVDDCAFWYTTHVAGIMGFGPRPTRIGSFRFDTCTANLTASPTTIPAGGMLTATWNGIAAPTPTNWIGLFTPSAANTAFIDWIYVSRSKTPGSPRASGSSFYRARFACAGNYELRLLANDGFTDLLRPAMSSPLRPSDSRCMMSMKGQLRIRAQQRGSYSR